ncbi:TPA: hypothetical protein H1005_02625 [archaeon]|uniref:Uncharacterized protein n=1 Tax=Candidatus Naiadarchaeum limnaeum TaxID=2756139 RepID=A0A832UMW6_9ARCH|nr:hypothetical protein [Candidatus Naiadarchaeales archaeon SRR2090153.bin1042]HIK00134.1 hypothetical protein [Candidatus Naiadarchaeum limnaeum]
MREKIKNTIRYFEYMFSIAGVIVAVSIYYYWKIFGQQELIKIFWAG